MAFLSALALPMEGAPAAAGMLLPYVTSVHQEVLDNWLDGGGEFPEEAFTLLRDCRLFDAADACDDTMILASEDAEGTVVILLLCCVLCCYWKGYRLRRVHCCGM
jgi:hypothetical protein